MEDDDICSVTFINSLSLSIPLNSPLELTYIIWVLQNSAGLRDESDFFGFLPSILHFFFFRKKFKPSILADFAKEGKPAVKLH